LDPIGGSEMRRAQPNAPRDPKRMHGILVREKVEIRLDAQYGYHVLHLHGASKRGWVHWLNIETSAAPVIPSLSPRDSSCQPATSMADLFRVHAH
jgi:hypothetical protein